VKRKLAYTAAFGGILFVAAGVGVRYALNEVQRSMGWK
jgi:hypothetical protein